jgi:hypothetical protein
MKPDVEDMSKRSPEQNAAGFIAFGDRYVEQMEAEGQQQLVESELIPTRMLHELTEQALTDLGFALGPPLVDDPLFREAKLPAGWSRVPSDRDSMWSYLVDGSGRCRFKVFYKASSHDRRAHMRKSGDDET